MQNNKVLVIICHCKIDDCLQDNLQQNWPSRYQHTSYTSLEISPQLASAQANMVLRDGKHRSHYQVLQQDAIHSSLWDTVDQQPCVIILMEVLDNLPHDR